MVTAQEVETDVVAVQAPPRDDLFDVAVRQFRIAADVIGLEDGIREVQAAGGFGVKVGDATSIAHHRLADVQAVSRWLIASAERLSAAAPSARGAA